MRARARLRMLVLGASVTCLLFIGVATAFALDQTPYIKLPVSDQYKRIVRGGDDLVAFAENGYVEYLSPNAVVAYDVRSSRIETIALDANLLDVDGRRIVWRANGGAEIHVTDFDTKADQVVSVPAGYMYDVALSGDNLVYVDGFNGLHGHNLRTGGNFTVSADSRATAPDIAGDWVVYSIRGYSGSSLVSDIYAYRISTGQRRALCTERHDQSYPRIASDGSVVWQDTRNSTSARTEYDLYGANVWSAGEYPVAVGSLIQANPMMLGNITAYCDDRKPGGYRVVGLDRLSGTTFGMCIPSLTSPDSVTSALEDGAAVWSKNQFILDGSPEGKVVSEIYVARPAVLDAVAAPDRFALAASASRSAFPTGAPEAIIASGLNWPDALAGAGLAGTDSPLLLTNPTFLPAATASELRRLGVTRVYLLGGPGSISPDVAAAIDKILADNAAVTPVALPLSGFSPAALAPAGSFSRVIRVAGPDRYETSGLIAELIAAKAGWDGTLFVASGGGFADALAASPVAASSSLPTLLSGPAGLSAANLDRIGKLGAKRVVIVGGPASVPAIVEAQVASIVGTSSVQRIWGDNRYSTAVAIASFGVDQYGLEWNGTGVASGSAFADAMVGGVMKGRQGSVLLLSYGQSLSAPTASLLAARRTEIRSAQYIGGPATITKTVRGQVRTILR